MKEYKIVVAGNGGVGKSALTLQYVQGIFLTSYDATIEDSYRKQTAINEQLSRLEILDTAGTEQFAGMRDLYIRNGQGFVLVFSLSDIRSFRDLRDLYRKIVSVKNTVTVPIVLVGNKSDVIEGREVAEETAKGFAKEMRAPYYETSAKNNINVAEVVFHECASRIETMNVEPKKFPQDDDLDPEESGKTTCCGFFRSSKE